MFAKLKKSAVLMYGVAAYLLFLGVFLYLIGFTGNMVVPKGLNDGVETALPIAILINLSLLLAFGVQHTIMARPVFKRWWTQYVPQAVERSTFVLATCGVLAVLFWQWRPIAGTVWALDHPVAIGIVYAVFALGWFLVLYSTFLINHFDLFGLRQVFLHWKNVKYVPVPMTVRSLYRWVRNPLMLGFLISVWATPTMSVGHLLFAIGLSAYIFIGVYFEERTLSHELGEVYRAYRKRTPMILPIPRGDSGTTFEPSNGQAAVEGD